MLAVFVFSGGVGFLLVSLLVVHGMRDALRGRPGSCTRTASRTGRWRYEAALTK
jgi:hypothetical protein